MTIDTKQLRDLAEKATPGVRHTGNGEHYAREVRTVSRAIAWCGHSPARAAHDDAAFIAACSPDVILALLDEVDRLNHALALAYPRALQAAANVVAETAGLDDESAVAQPEVES